MNKGMVICMAEDIAKILGVLPPDTQIIIPRSRMGKIHCFSVRVEGHEENWLWPMDSGALHQ